MPLPQLLMGAACSSITPVAASVVTWPSSLGICRLQLSLLIRTTVIGFRAILIQYDLILT